MVVSNLVTPVSVSKMAQIAIDCGARVSGGTNMKTLGKRISQLYGLSMTTTNDINVVLFALSSGDIAIANVDGDKGNPGIFSNGGHYLTLYNVWEGGNDLTVLDPGYYAGKYDTAYRKQFVRLSGIRSMIFTTPEAIDADAETRPTRYYVFRKVQV